MRARNHRSRFVCLSFIGALAAACASEPPPRPTKLDPSSPAAAESAPLSMGPLTQPPPSVEGKADHDAAALPAPMLYTCPMHPEVISDKPGKCPKCGMTLVPKQPEAKP